METKEINQENIITLVKLGIEVNDIANIYVAVTKKGQEISKQEFIQNLTKLLKFFQKRNKTIEEETQGAIYKEDVIQMLQKNKKLITLDIAKTIEPICQKIDSYYFIKPSDTNKIIKKNPNIFNRTPQELEIYGAILSCFAIQINDTIVNLFEYVIKQQSQILNEDIQKIYQRLCYIKQATHSTKITVDDITMLKEEKFSYQGKEIEEGTLKEKYSLPKYNGNTISSYKEKILEKIQK